MGNSNQKKIAVVAGATGLTGSILVEKLAKDDRYKKVIALTRSQPKGESEHVEWLVFDYSEPTYELPPCDDVFCCLGTTIKKAGSQAAFREVDYAYPRKLAKAAATAGARSFAMVSSIGADPKSPVFYLRTKGEAEEAARQAGLPLTVIVRPSFLAGDREENRFGEKIGLGILGALSPLMIGGLKKYAPVSAEAVASAMIRAVNTEKEGVIVIESDRIQGEA